MSTPILSTHIASDGSVFGTPDPALIAQTHERQTIFNTNMISYRLKDGRPEVIIKFRTKTHMPTVDMTAGMFPDLVNIEVMTRHFVIVSIPYRSDEDVERMRRHFTDIRQMTHFN